MLALAQKQLHHVTNVHDKYNIQYQKVTSSYAYATTKPTVHSKAYGAAGRNFRQHTLKPREKLHRSDQFLNAVFH